MSRSPGPVVLVVDDKRNMLSLMAKVLRGVAGILTADRGETAMSILARETVDVVLCDLRMPDVDGITVFRECKRLQPRARFILMTAYATVDTAVTALKHGVYDYLTKPFDPELARDIVQRALHSGPVRAVVRQADELLPGVHGRSRIMRELANVVRILATTEANVTLVGEAGVGKTRVAMALHRLSSRRDGPFVVMNGRSVSADGRESGQVGDIETPSASDLFSQATGGTLLLQEVDAMSELLQSQLVRVLEAMEVRHPPIRLIVAGPLHPDEAVRSGVLREDLRRALGNAVVTISPLRRRDDDIPVLCAHLLEHYRTGPEGSKQGTGFTATAMEALVDFDWIGNVAQLKATIREASLLAEGDLIDIDHLPAEFRVTGPGHRSWDTMTWADALARGRSETAHRYLVAVLRRFDGDVVKAATVAGIERESFYRLLRRHGIQPEGFRSDGGS